MTTPRYNRANPYRLSDEHRAQLDGWARRWIANAMSTRPMDDTDREAMRSAIDGMYDAAGLSRPRHVVFVPSPLVLAFAGSFAAGIWHWSRHGLPAATADATAAATRAATAAATRAATADATYDATYAATDAATDAATHAATYDATDAATADATYDATYDTMYDATYAATYAATDAATYDVTDAAAAFLLRCCSGYLRMWNGGNQWSGWCAYLSFFRHVAQLRLPEYDRWQHYEAAAIHGGPRIMHPDFCMVSDRPELIRVDDQNRPHSVTGPSHRWRDGWELFHIDGVRIDRRIVMQPDTLTVSDVLGEENATLRRIMMRQAGEGRILTEANAEVVHEDRDELGMPRRLLRLTMDNEPWMFVGLCDPAKNAVEPSDFLRVPPDMERAGQAAAWTFGIPEEEYVLGYQS